MASTDYCRARLELTIDSSGLRDLDRLEEGKFILEKMDHVARRTIQASEELLDNLMRSRLRDSEIQRLRHASDRARQYYLPSDWRGRVIHTDHKVYPGHRRAYSIPDAPIGYPSATEKKPLYRHASKDYGFESIARGDLHARGSIEARLQKVRLQNRLLRAGLVRSDQELFDHARPCLGANSTRRTSGGDEMCTRGNVCGVGQCCMHECRENKARQPSKEINIEIDDKKDQSGGAKRLPNLDSDRSNNCKEGGSSKPKGLKDRTKKDLFSNQGQSADELMQRNQLTLKKAAASDETSLLEIVQDQNKLITRLTEQLQIREGNSSISNIEKSNKDDLRTNSLLDREARGRGSACELSKGFENEEAYSPVFGKTKRKPSDVSFEVSKYSKGQETKNPRVNNIIHFQDGISQIQHKENSLGSFNDLQLKLKNIEKLKEEQEGQENKSADMNGRSTAGTAPERVRDLLESFRNKVHLKPYSSRDKFRRVVEDSSKYKGERDSPDGQKSGREQTRIKKSSSKRKKETPITTKKIANQRPVSMDKRGRTKTAQKRTSKERHETSPGKKIKVTAFKSTSKKQPIGMIRSKKHTAGPKPHVLTSESACFDRRAAKRPLRAGDASIDKMFSSGALYQPDLMKANGFDSFNNGLIAYCFLKRRIAPEYKKKVDALVDRIEDYMVERRLAKLANKFKNNCK